MTPNPFQYLLPVAPEGFIGRWPMVKDIALDLILHGGNSHAIVAGRRCGKSSILHAIAHQLSQPAILEAANFYPLPALFDFKSGTFDSTEMVLAALLLEVRRRADKSIWRRALDPWSQAIALNDDQFLKLTQAPKITLRDFEDALGYVLDQLDQQGHSGRFIFLIDEIDETLDQPWTEALFNQLRSLIYSGDLRNRVRLVISGSRRFLDMTKPRGSPLWNILKLHFIQAFDKLATMQLISRAEGIPKEVEEIIWQQSGGHPFIVQYILYHLWEAGIAEASNGSAMQLTGRFLHEQSADLEGWARGVEQIGLLVYSTLLGATDWVKESTIMKKINDPNVDVKRGLTALCYHGLVVHDDSWECYKRGSDLFMGWFLDKGAALMAEPQAKTAQIPGIGPISANIFNYNPQGQFEQGNRTTVRDINASSGIDISNQTPTSEVSMDEKSNAANAPSSGDIQTGNIIGSTGVAVGHGTTVNVTQTQGSNSELEKAFAAVLAKLNDMPAGPDKDDAKSAIGNLKAEAEKGDQATESRIQRWFAFLADTAPDAWEVAVDTFSNPIKGVSTLVQKIAAKAKAEHTRA